MRKKSHILLARYLADRMTISESLQSHRKAFCLGNILPDIRPSFVTKRHEFFGTFSDIQEQLCTLIKNENGRCSERVFWRRLGEIIHYIADYFTFPHNKCYSGNLFQHNKYEKNLKNQLKKYILSGQADLDMEEDVCFEDFSDLVAFIRNCHICYMDRVHNVADDIHYILSVCYQVIRGVVQLCMNPYFQCSAA